MGGVSSYYIVKVCNGYVFYASDRVKGVKSYPSIQVVIGSSSSVYSPKRNDNEVSEIE